MRVKHRLLVVLFAVAVQSAAAADPDLLVASPDAPLYQLSNLRTEVDSVGVRKMSVDFKRTRPGSGTVAIRGRSSRGIVAIAASVPTSVESGTMQLTSFLPDRQQQIDIELFFAQPHDWHDGKVRIAVVSNSLRLGNPGEAIKPRAWTQEEVAAYENHKRIMADDSAAKPRKSYAVSIDLPGDSEFVPPEARIVPGTPLEACYSGKWNPLTVLSENKDGSINLRWNDYGPQYDCSMVREELIIKKAYLAKTADGGRVSMSRAEMEKSGVIEPPAKPRKSYPVSIAVPSHSQPVPADAKVESGTRLQACYASKWNPITALSENKDGTLNVRWDDYGPAFDCSMVREELIIRKTALSALREKATAASPLAKPANELRTWTDASGKFSVQAKLVSKTETAVTLLTAAGKEVTLPLAKLSEVDRQFLESVGGR